MGGEIAVGRCCGVCCGGAAVRPACLGPDGDARVAGVLATRRAQELTGRGAVEQPRLNAAYAQGSEGPAPEAETAHPARFATNLTYTSLDAPDDGSAGRPRDVG